MTRTHGAMKARTTIGAWWIGQVKGRVTCADDGGMIMRSTICNSVRRREPDRSVGRLRGLGILVAKRQGARISVVADDVLFLACASIAPKRARPLALVWRI